MRVLYVDDDRVNSLLFVELCRMATGVTVQTAGSGEEALDVLPAFAPEVLVLDLHLPDGDGFALLPRLRQLAGRELPAYLCSADDPAQIEPRARASGFAGCWTKPLDVSRMLQTLREIAQSGSGAAS
jgi:CheY-like chemotaxis protein